MRQKRKINIMSRMFAVVLAVMMVCSNISLPSKAAETIQTIAAWEYKDTESAPTQLPAGATLGSGKLDITGAAYTGYSSKSLAANNWVEESAWVISEINAEKYTNLTFSASLRSSKTGPKDFELEYSLDEGQSWSAVDGGAVEITSTNLIQLYKEVKLPAELSGKIFMLRVKKVGSASVNGGTVAEGGVSNINNIVLKGTTEGEEKPQETCAGVEASVVPGVVEKGTEVSLSCKTEGAEIYYKVNDAQEFVKYDAAIAITEDTTITAYSKKEGFQDSEQKTFSYTVEKEIEPEPEPEPTIGRLMELKDGDVFAIYNPANKKVMSASASGTRLAALDGEPSSEDVLDVPNGAAVLQASLDAKTGYYTLTAQGKYLTSGKTGNSLTLEEEASDYSLWDVEKADENGGFFLRSVNAEYGGNKNQYIEYFNTFTTYGKKVPLPHILWKTMQAVHNRFLLSQIRFLPCNKMSNLLRNLLILCMEELLFQIQRLCTSHPHPAYHLSYTNLRKSLS